MHAHDHRPRPAVDADGTPVLEVRELGDHLLGFPLLNKGTAFSEAERDALMLRGLLPPVVATQAEQVALEIANIRAKQTDLERYVYLTGLMDRNETLYYRVVLDHLEELLPIVYTPTVGQACQRFGEIYRRGRGLYLGVDDTDRIGAVLDNWPVDEVRLIVVTDGERILGLGDLGAHGMGISIGKLALYVVAAGISPWHVMPVTLDVGTKNEALRNDAAYLGIRAERTRGERYDALVEAFLSEVHRRYPGCMVQFEDFAHTNSFRLLDRYRDRYLTFNDDIQGTGAVAFAGLLSSQRVTGLQLADQRVVVVGGGSAGIGICRQVRAGFLATGMSEDEARDRIWVLDSRGLITEDRPGVRGNAQKLEFARRGPTSFDAVADGADLRTVIDAVKPTALVGVTGQPGLFDHDTVSAMAAHVERPVVFALSNPTANSECTPHVVYEATGGRGLASFGSPFEPFEWNGARVVPGQGNNVYIFPGLGLGALAVGATSLPDGALYEAAVALASTVPDDALGAGTLYPPIANSRSIARTVAVAVGRYLVREGLARDALAEADVEPAVDASIWVPDYLRYRRAD